MNNRPASLVVAIFLWLIAVAQLLRVVFRVDVRGAMSASLSGSVSWPSSCWRPWESGFGASAESDGHERRFPAS